MAFGSPLPSLVEHVVKTLKKMSLIYVSRLNPDNNHWIDMLHNQHIFSVLHEKHTQSFSSITSIFRHKFHLLKPSTIISNMSVLSTNHTMPQLGLFSGMSSILALARMTTEISTSNTLLHHPRLPMDLLESKLSL